MIIIKKLSVTTRLALSIVAALFTVSIEAHSPLQKPEKITRANWRTHPRIEEVRAIVRSVNEGWANREFKTSERRFENCEDTFAQFRRLTVDRQGVVRRYEYEYAAEDEGRTDQYYYDEAGRLRFVLITAGAANGSRLRHRIYFDEKGKRLWEEHRVTGGLGHFWPETWPNDQLHRTDAAKAFAKTDGCKEVNPRSKADELRGNGKQNKT